MFAALRKAFGDRYLYAGLGTVLPLATATGTRAQRGEAAALSGEELETYQRLAHSSPDAMDSNLAHAGHDHAEHWRASLPDPSLSLK